MNNYESSGATNERLGGLLLPHDAQQFTQLHGLQGLLRVVTRRLKWIIISIVVCELFAIVVTLRTRPVYEATATIELNKSGSGSMDLGLGNMLSDQIGSDEDSLLIDQQTETTILQGDSLALEVIQRLGLISEPPFATKDSKALETNSAKDSSLDSPVTRTRLLSIFKSNLKVNPFRGTRLIQVVYQSHDPEQAARIANAIIDSYKNQYLQSHYNATSEASDWLTKQLSELKTNVFVRPSALKSDWNRDSIQAEIGAQGVPCFAGSCSEIYLEKAFPTDMRPKERLPVARELGKTSLMFLVHPTLKHEDIARTCEIVRQVMRKASQ